MSHVDEGTLHAYLDGELPSNERSTVDDHLAQCADCRAMLAEERALRERASALLGAARPVERPVPPFERIRRTPKRSPWVVRMGFAWAATIAVAVGIGYYLRSPERAPVPSAETRRVSLPTAPVAVATSGRRAAAAAHDEQAAPVTGKSADSVPALQRPRLNDSVGAIAMETPQLRNAAPSAAEPAPSASLMLASPRSTMNTPITTQWPVISHGTAASILGAAPVGLPGLATRRIQRSPVGDGMVVVEQALDSSTVIQIFQRAAAAGYEVDSFASSGAIALRERSDRRAKTAAAPADRLARFVGRLRVEIAGPLTADSLNKLLEQVEPLP